MNEQGLNLRVILATVDTGSLVGEELATDLWLLTHPDLRQVARIRAFMAFGAEVLQKSVAGPSSLQ
ncbi:hypothetical protein [Halomonas salipaludis]|uniref:Uncharacterized protein n=1 Tax=Halomonas salipaludis TaxID=2032625 RepID=A0A2A2ET38_9GAMM|nr:hypothetical protein [Halomonas salipaludis]PAU75463.1 hypothetical protein CK498_16150 [Halomonas salipaludis]